MPMPLTSPQKYCDKAHLGPFRRDTDRLLLAIRDVLHGRLYCYPKRLEKKPSKISLREALSWKKRGQRGEPMGRNERKGAFLPE